MNTRERRTGGTTSDGGRQMVGHEQGDNNGIFDPPSRPHNEHPSPQNYNGRKSSPAISLDCLLNVRQRLHTLHETTQSATASDQTMERELEENLERLIKRVESVHTRQGLNRREDFRDSGGVGRGYEMWCWRGRESCVETGGCGGGGGRGGV